ncbi:hypothetical protein GHT06_018413 [Daphnia sinensis]|uniref:Uncharacterized protein n=1 Tax=Daphnia sinensis TaxID=1820382 RepID=A0AAD5KN62_9CRUS|nr:hypothetical protein GHT06_018413 [Daphnia sinensis]
MQSSSTPRTRIVEVPSEVNYCFPVIETSVVSTPGCTTILPAKRIELQHPLYNPGYWTALHYHNPYTGDSWPTRRDQGIIYSSPSNIGGDGQYTDSSSKNSTFGSTRENEESILSNVNTNTNKQIITNRQKLQELFWQREKQQTSNRPSSVIYSKSSTKNQASKKTNSHTSQHEFDRWIKLFEIGLAKSNWNDDEKINMLITKMTDTANEFLKNILESCTQDYKEIKALETFNPCHESEGPSILSNAEVRKELENFAITKEVAPENSNSSIDDEELRKSEEYRWMAIHAFQKRIRNWTTSRKRK